VPRADSSPLIRLLVVTPDDVVIDQRVVSVRLQQADGWRGILAHHVPYITQLVNGVMMYRLPEEDEHRYLEVQENMIVVLTSAAEHGDSLQTLARSILERQAEEDALALEAHIEFTKVRTALVRALTDLPPPPEGIR
jgi:F0F1-type ATP synthase epsilon subunit